MTTLPFKDVGSGRAEQLARIADAGIVAQGRVFLLSLEALKNELGSRWPQRADLIWESFTRDLTRALPAPDQFVRLDEVTILAAIVSTDAYSGQVRCAQAFRETLAFFLGRTQESDFAMSRVSVMTEDGITAEPINADTPPPAAASVSPPPSNSPEQWIPPLSSRQSGLMFLTERDGPVSIGLSISPVWRLDRRLVAAYAIRRSLPRPLESFTDRDREAIDLCVADFLEPIMRDYRSAGGAFAVICPFTLATLATRSSRLRLVQRCAPILDIMRQAVVLTIDGVAVGSPDGRLRETVSMCRPMARLITLATAEPAAIDRLRGDHGANGAAINAEDLMESQVASMVARLRRHRANIVVHGVPRDWDIARLADAGATHVTERPVPSSQGSTTALAAA